MTRDEARDLIKQRYADYLPAARKKGYVCPLCNNGTGESGDGLREDPNGDGTQLHCFKCGFHGDLIDIYKAENSCDYNTAFNDLCSRFNIVVDEKSYPTDKKNPTKATSPQMPPKEKPIKEKTDFTEYLKSCKNKINEPEAQDYLKFRGLSQETAARFWLGFDDHKKEFIIPVSKHYYVARRLYSTGDIPRYDNPAGASVELFNTQALYNDDARPVFIVEGAFDALSVIEGGGLAVALNSTSNKKLLVAMLEKKRTTSTLLLSLDNDQEGKDATAELEAELKRINIPYVLTSVSGKYKDANENMLADKKAFKETVQAIERAANKPYNTQDYIRRSMAAEINNLKSQSNRKTGYDDIDSKLYSLYPGLYVIGAVSSLGKTTFVYQMCDQMAARGEHILFYSLEQSRLELVSKSLARYTALEDPTQAVNSLQIRTGYKPSIVDRAIERYIHDVGDRVQIIEGNFYITGEEIEKEVKHYIEKNKVSPIVIVDYLQVLQPSIDPETGKKPTDPRAIVEANIKALKRMSRSLNIPVIVISSVNRQNYELPIDFESFKESGLIEFTADFVAGLQLTVIHSKVFNSTNKAAEKRETIRKAKDAIPREIEFVVLKNRFGTRFESYFDYYPQFDLFRQTKPKFENPYSEADIL